MTPQPTIAESDEMKQSRTPVHRLIETQARRTPDRLAFTDASSELTYRQLDLRADALARVLRAGGVRRETPVGLYLDRSADLLVALLAVFKSAGTAHLLDPRWPHQRTTALLAATPPRVLLARPAALPRPPRPPAARSCRSIRRPRPSAGRRTGPFASRCTRTISPTSCTRPDRPARPSPPGSPIDPSATASRPTRPGTACTARTGRAGWPPRARPRASASCGPTSRTERACTPPTPPSSPPPRSCATGSSRRGSPKRSSTP